jgi:hypothetical protein
MSEPVILGDALPDLVSALLAAQFASDLVCGFGARSADYEIFEIAYYPGGLVSFRNPNNPEVDHIRLPTQSVMINKEEQEKATDVKIFPYGYIIVIVGGEEILYRSSLINLVWPYTP